VLNIVYLSKKTGNAASRKDFNALAVSSTPNIDEKKIACFVGTRNASLMESLLLLILPIMVLTI